MLKSCLIREILRDISFVAIKSGLLMIFFCSPFFVRVLTWFDCLKKLSLLFDFMFIAAPLGVEFVFQGWSVVIPQSLLYPRAQ